MLMTNKMDVNVDSLDRTDLYPASSGFVGEWDSDFNTYGPSYLIPRLYCNPKRLEGA